MHNRFKLLKLLELICHYKMLGVMEIEAERGGRARGKKNCDENMT